MAGPNEPVPRPTAVPNSTTSADLPDSYISYRQSYNHHPAKRKPYKSVFSGDEDRRGLLSPGADRDDVSDSGDAVIEMDLLPPRWADVSDEVNEMLATIARKSVMLDRLHSKHVLPGFDDNRSAEEGEIERLTTDITAMFHKCQDRIRTIPEMAGAGKADESMARNIQVALATKVQESSTMFRKKQSAYLKSERPSGVRLRHFLVNMSQSSAVCPV